MPICFRLLTHWDRRAASRAAWTAGSRRAIRTAMIAMTTSNSIRVKAREDRETMGHLDPLVGTGELEGDEPSYRYPTRRNRPRPRGDRGCDYGVPGHSASSDGP